jgi:translation initiation factor eIF-2B subunit alpha
MIQGYGIPICQIADSAVGYVIDKVDKVFIGAEGVAESGGVISNVGTYQNSVLAKNANKPVYVFSESHKFVRLYPLSPSDISTSFQLKFSTEDVPTMSEAIDQSPEVDFTPHQYITALVTDLGVLTPSGVSEELIKIWFD